MSRRAPIFGNTPHKNCRCSCDCHQQHSPSGNSRYFQSITSQNNKNHQQSVQEQRRHRSTSRKRIPIFSKCNKKQRINYLLRAPYTESITQHQNQNPKQKLYEDNNDKNKTFENNIRKSNISFSQPNTQTQKRRTQNPYHTISYSKEHRIQGLMHPVQLTNLIYKVRLAHYKKAFHYNHL